MLCAATLRVCLQISSGPVNAVGQTHPTATASRAARTYEHWARDETDDEDDTDYMSITDSEE